MSDARLESYLDLDTAEALRRVDRLNQDLSRATTGIPVTADARAVTAAIDAAVQNAQSLVQVAADAHNVTGSIDAAVEAADTAVQVTGDAADLTGEITAAVDAADTAVTVTGDARDLTGDINQAVDAADTSVQVTGEARDVTARINAAVDAADTAVTVTGDARELTGDITAAVDAADTHVTVSGSVDQSLRRGVQGLDDDLQEATAQAGLLRSSIAAIGVGAVLGALYAAATAASNLGESSSKASVVFGDSFDRISDFAKDAATSVGLSEQAALEATGTFGNLFQSLGATQEVAADLSPQVVQLAGDLASFNNLGVEETLERLRSGLVGEIEPLRGLGVSFGAAEVEAKAFELGLADANGQVSEGAKLQARFALIMEQTTLAQGDFARTSAGLANQQRILNAEFDNAVTVAGQALLPVLLDLVGTARSDLIPAFQEFATTTLPPLASIFVDLIPLLGSSVQLLTLFAPVISAVASAVDAVPAPLLAALGGFIALNKVTGPLSSGLDRVAFSIFDLAGGKGLARMNPFLVAAAAGVAVLTARATEAAAKKARLREVTADLTEALKDEDGVLRITERALSSFLTGLDEGRLLMAGLGASSDELAATILRGGDALETYESRVDSLDGTFSIFGDALGRVRQSLEETAASEIIAAEAAGAITEAQAENALSSDNVALAYQGLRAQIDEHNAALEAATAKYGPQIAAAKELGTAFTTLSGTNRALAQDLVTFREEGVENDAQLAQFILRLREAALSEEEMGAAAALLGTDMETLQGLVDAVGEAVDGFVDSALQGLPSVVEELGKMGDVVDVGDFIENLQESAASVEQFMQNLDLIFRAGGEDLAATLAEAGLAGGGSYARELAASINPQGESPLVTQAEAAVDNHNAVIARAEIFLREEFGPAYIASTGLVASLASEALGSNLSFAERTRIAANLAETTLDEEGKAIALIAATEGARAASEYARLFKIDDDVLAEGLAVGQTLNTDRPGIIPAASGLADRASGGWSGRLRAGWGRGAVEATDLARTTIEQSAPGIAAASERVGTAGGGGWSQRARLGWGQGASEAVETARSTIAAAGLSSSALYMSAARSGREVANAFSVGLRGQMQVNQGSVLGATAGMVSTALNVSSTASTAGRGVGFAFDDGMASGMIQRSGVVQSAARQVVADAEAAAKRRARITSPSRVWYEIGSDLNRGLILGMSDSQGPVMAQASATIAAATTAAVEEANEQIRLANWELHHIHDRAQMLRAREASLTGWHTGLNEFGSFAEQMAAFEEARAAGRHTWDGGAEDWGFQTADGRWIRGASESQFAEVAGLRTEIRQLEEMYGEQLRRLNDATAALEVAQREHAQAVQEQTQQARDFVDPERTAFPVDVSPLPVFVPDPVTLPPSTGGDLGGSSGPAVQIDTIRIDVDVEGPMSEQAARTLGMTIGEEAAERIRDVIELATDQALRDG